MSRLGVDALAELLLKPLQWNDAVCLVSNDRRFPALDGIECVALA